MRPFKFEIWKVSYVRQCSKPGCRGAAVATLTYDYANSTAVLGPISTTADPHAFDLCESHAEGLTVPRGWEVIRLQSRFEPAPPSADDLLALVEVVREVAGRPTGGAESATVHNEPDRGRPESPEDKYAPLRRREHFTVVAGDAPAKSEERSSLDSRLGPLAGEELGPRS